MITLVEYYTRRDSIEQAVDSLNRALEIEKNNPAVLAGLARVYLEFGKIDQAARTVKKVLKDRPDAVNALLQKGRVLMYRKKYQAALEIFDTLINKDRYNAEAYYYKALSIEKNAFANTAEDELYRAAAGMLEDPEAFSRQEVKKNLEAAVAINPDLLDVRVRLAKIYLIEKEEDKAEEQIREVYRLAPETEKTAMLATALKLVKGQKEEALMMLERLARNNPNHFRVHARLGLLYYSTGRYDKAVEVLKNAYAMEPSALGLLEIVADSYIKQGEYEKAYAVIEESMANAGGGTSAAALENLRGEVMLRNGREEKALAHFDKARSLDPGLIKPVLHAAEILRRQKQFNRAADLFRDAVRIDPKNTTALMGLGYINDVLGESSQAEQFYNRVLDVDLFYVMASNNLAFLLAERNAEPDRALKLARFARGKRPEDPDMLDTLGWVYYKKESFRSAVSELEETLSINPDNALACYHMGMALYKSGKYEKARTHLKKALALDPSFQGAESAKSILN